MNNGNHFGGYKYRNKRDRGSRTRNSIFGTIISLVAGTIVKDLTSDDSKLKKLVNNFIHPKQIEDTSDKKVIDAEYKIIENKNKDKKND